MPRPKAAVSPVPSAPAADAAASFTDRQLLEVFEQAAAGMAVLAPDGRFLRPNHAIGILLGHAPAELMGRSSDEFVHPDDAPQAARLRQQLLEGPLNRCHSELRLSNGSGTARWGRFTWSLVRDERRRPAYFIWQAEDITERRVAEQAMRDSEERFRGMTFLTADNYWEQDAQFRFTQVRIADRAREFMFTDALGLRRWEIPGVTPLNGSFEEHRRVLEARQPFNDFRYMRRHAGGRIAYVSVSGEPVVDAAGALLGYRGTARDITEEILAQRRLQEAQAMLHMAAQIGRLGAWMWDLGAPGLVWSPEVCAIFEVHGDFAPTTQEAMAFVAPEYRRRLRQALRDCSRQGTAFDLEAEVVTARGRRVWVRLLCEPQWDEAGQVRRIHGACQDISEQKQSTEKVRRLAGQLTATLESLTDAFFTIDRNWRFTYLNAEAEKLIARSRESVLGAGLFELLPQLRGRVAEREFQRAMRENVTVDFEEYYEPLNIWLQVKAYPSEQGLAVDVKNISERHRARQEILRLNAELEDRVQRRTAQLEAANKEMESFSYSIAHDVRAPLSTIDGFSQMLEQVSQGRLDSRGQHYLQRIRKAVRHMGELTDGLLALSNLTRASLRREPVDLAVLARAAIDMCVHQSPERVVDVVIASPLPVLGDSRLLAQVVGNLVGNAWKFTSRTAGARIEVGQRTWGDQVVYFVRDNGAGFDMAHAGKLFDAFQRLHTPAEFEGTGIGLAIVHKIVAQHGGRVWAEATPGQGACFQFTLAEGPLPSS